jgi:hypothetical protein
MKTAKSDSICQIKVTLLHTKPLVWRRLLVPADMMLDQLHLVIQASMEWLDSHLHQFRVGDVSFRAEDPFVESERDEDSVDECQVQLSTVLKRVGDEALYTYDFGDDWEHSILLEKTLPRDPNSAYPVCIAGKRCGPLDDTGGPYGYHHMLQVLKDPKHEEYEELMQSSGAPYDPAYFSLADINARLAPLRSAKANSASIIH